MKASGGWRIFGRALFFGMALLALASAAGAEASPDADSAVIFDMERLISADPRDAAALEEAFDSPQEKGLLAPAAGYALARTLILSGRLSEARAALEKTEAMLQGIRGDDARRGTLATHVYLELIVDGPTWIRYGPRLESSMAAMAEAGAPCADITYAKAKRLSLFPPEIGGDLARSLELFDSLGEARGLFEFVSRYASALIAAGDREKARALLESLEAADGRDSEAAGLLCRIRAEDSQAKVVEVVLPSGIRAARGRIERAIRLRAGSSLTSRAVEEDLRRLGELPGIVRADVRCRYDEAANEAEVEYVASEEKSRSLTISASSSLRARPGESGFGGAIAYGDSNLLGLGWRLDLTSAAVYNRLELSKDGVGSVPLDIRLEAEGMLLSGKELAFYDEHGLLEEDRALSSKYLRAGSAVGLSGPLGIRLSASYGICKDWYSREGETPDSFVLPDDILHTARMAIDMDMESRRGPAGLVPVGARLGAQVEYGYYQGFREWGSPGFWNTAPGNGLGTLKYSVEARFGKAFLERFNVGVALGGYGGTNFCTRALYRLGGSAGPMDSTQSFLRGYRDGEFAVESAWIGHLDAGCEIVEGALHLGLFSDIAKVRSALAASGSWRTLCSAGLGVGVVLPWDINLYATYARGFVDLTGSFDHEEGAISFFAIRSFSW